MLERMINANLVAHQRLLRLRPKGFRLCHFVNQMIISSDCMVSQKSLSTDDMRNTEMKPA